MYLEAEEESGGYTEEADAMAAVGLSPRSCGGSCGRSWEGETEILKAETLRI